MREFRRLVNEDLEPLERQRIRDALIAYCRLDTEAMVLLLNKLAEVAGYES